jgi:hypothetical protein
MLFSFGTRESSIYEYMVQYIAALQSLSNSWLSPSTSTFVLSPRYDVISSIHLMNRLAMEYPTSGS